MNKINTSLIVIVSVIAFFTYVSSKQRETATTQPAPVVIPSEIGKTDSSKPTTLPENGRVRAPVDIVLAQNQPKNAMGLDITLVSITDSRCPSDVQCVWVGKATTSLKITSLNNGISKTISLDLGSTPIVYAGYEISLTDVKPLPKTGAAILTSLYRATVHVASSYTNIVDNPETAQTDTGKLCVNSGGLWDSLHRECGGISELSCREIKGVWNECGSACRHNPKAEMCTMQCVQFCQLKKIVK